MKERLLTKDYCSIVAANFLLYFGFWLMIPILPMYLKSTFECGTGLAGLIISCYTLTALCMRPFSGYLFDTFSRKPLYIIGYLLFVTVFAGYQVAGSIALFTCLRAIHGLAFGLVTVGGNTMVVDIMPQSRRGEGLGYYGMANNMAMAIGPMVGITIYNNSHNFPAIFTTGLVICGFGLLMGSLFKTPYSPPLQREPFKLKKIILVKGIPAGIALLLLSIPYGMTTNYIAIYAQQIGLLTGVSFFFTLTAFGMAIARILAGKLVDKGYITEIIQNGFYGVIASFVAIAMLGQISDYSSSLGMVIFYIIPIVMGLSFGVMFPAYNSVFVNLAPASQRGVATSTYLTSWDIGLGLGIVFGGQIAQMFNFSCAYLFGTTMSVVAAILFKFWVTPEYKKNVGKQKNEVNSENYNLN